MQRPSILLSKKLITRLRGGYCLEALISITSFLLCLCSYFLNKRHIINPMTLFHGLWGFLFLVFGFRFQLFPAASFIELSVDVTGYYLVFFLTFFFGGVVSHIIFRLLSNRIPLGKAVLSDVAIFDASRYQIVKLISYAALALSVAAVFTNKFSLMDYASIGGTIRASMTEEYKPTEGMFSLLASYFSWIALPICTLLLIKTKQRKLWMYFPYVALILVSIISLGKYNLILMLALVFNIWLLCQKLQLRTLKKVAKPISIALITIVLLFGGSAYLRDNISTEIDYSTRSYPIAFLIFMYGFGNINNFSEYYTAYNQDSGQSSTQIAGFTNFKTSQDLRWGEVSFSGLYRVGYWLGLADSVSYTRYEGVRNFNTYSILRNYIDDFGVRGSYFAAFLTGFFCNFLFLITNKNKASGIIFVALIFCFIQYTAIHSLFNFIFFYITILAAPLVSKVRFGKKRGVPPYA